MQKVVMTHSVIGEANEDGTAARKYMAGEELPLSKAWQKKLAKDMIKRGAAMEVQANTSPPETKKAPAKKRGRPKKKPD